MLDVMSTSPLSAPTRRSRRAPVAPSCATLWNNQKRFMRTYILEWNKVLGQGGFGIVLSGHRDVDKAPVAVKFICKEDIRLWKRMGNKTRGPKEAFLLEKVQHVDGVIKVYEFMELGEYYAIIMEHIPDSETLHHFVEKNGTLDEEEAKNLMKQMLQIVSSCLKEGVVHRDLKVDNILIDKQTLKLALIDFGCGAIAGDPMVPATKFNDLGAWLQEYMYLRSANNFHFHHGAEELCPPEWIKYKNYYVEPGTVWSLGVLLHFLIHGYLPFNNEKEVLEAKVRIGASVEVSYELKDFLKQCFISDFKQRARLGILREHPWITGLRIPPSGPKVPPLTMTLRRSKNPLVLLPTIGTSDNETKPAAKGTTRSYKRNAAVSDEIPSAKRLRRK